MKSLKQQFVENSISKFRCRYRKTTAYAIVVTLCLTSVCSEGVDDQSTDLINEDYPETDVPDVTYFPITDLTMGSWYDEDDGDDDFQTSPLLDAFPTTFQPSLSWSASSEMNTSLPSKATAREDVTSFASFPRLITDTTPQEASSHAHTTSVTEDTTYSRTTSTKSTTSKFTSPASEQQTSAPLYTLTVETQTALPSSQTPPSEEESSRSPSTTLPVFVPTAVLTTTSSLSTISSASAPPSPKFCNITQTSMYQTKCTPCFLQHHCHEGDIQEDDSMRSCGPRFSIPRCQITCLHVYKKPACCRGYWGENCEECPGGSSNPCNGRGQCQSSSGTCICQAEFSGTACELCENSNKYGQDCSQDCQCVHGICSNGVHGDGSCTCESGYKGETCDIEIPECRNMTCHRNDTQGWRCADVNGAVKCVCAVGYEYDSILEDCEANDPCDSPISLCGKNSRCEQTGLGKHKCTCEDGYAGDGIVCLPIDPCQTNRGGCEETAICRYTGPNQHVCLCRLGYENYIPGTGCTLTNMCTKNSCDAMAICETVEPLKVRCTCKEGYAGNGTVCYGNILERMKDINSNNQGFKDDLLYAINLISRFYAEPMTKHGPFTLFVPTDRAFRDVIKANKGFDKFLNDEDRAMQILRQHILIGQFKLEDLQSFDTFYTLQGNAAQLQIRVARDIFRYKLQGGSDRAKVLARDFIASNGIIHIVNNLLTLEPEILGDKQKTAMDLIKLEGTYNRFQSLIMSAGLADIFSQSNITVFAPENNAWDALPTGTLDYLMKDEEGQEKLKVILKNHVFPGVIGVTHLINMPSIKSFANVEVKVTISNLGKILLDDKVSVTQVNIPCSTGFYHHIEGILIPSYIDQILPNRCPVIFEKEVKGACVSCKENSHCPQPTDKPTNDYASCTYFSRHRGRLRRFLGCAWLCTREVSVPKCCEGFYGTDCLPCPGGYKNPCNGRGECSDGLTGSGLCFCVRDYMGKSCDQCRQKNVFGPYCNETCTCLYGQCDDGPGGSGMCKKDTCQSEYQSDNCDKKLVPCPGSSLLCHAHSKCFVDDLNVARCQCEMGYEGDGDECKEIDPCVRGDNGGCHQQATCTKVGPGVSRCECNYGWFGDGFNCSPKTPCLDHTDCDVNANCYNSEPGQYHCVCKIGYRGNGKICEIVNVCVQDNGGCHPKAICTPLKAGERNCTCPDNLTGDGITCFGTIAQEVMVHPNLTRLAELLKILDDSDNLLDNVDDNMTLFAPSDPAMETFMLKFSTWNRTSYWQDEENVIWFLNFHTVYSDYSTADLIAWEGVLKTFPTMYDGFSLHIVKTNNTLRIFVNHSDFATVAEPGIPTLNGYIHIIDKVLEPFLPDDQVPTLSEALASQPQYQLFYEALQVTGVLDQIKDLDEYTVFVPINAAIKQLNRTVNAEFIKYYIVPKLVFSPSVLDSDSIDTLLGPQHRLLLTLTQNTIKVNGVQVTRADILLDGGVMHEIGGVLHPVLNRCDFNTSELKVGDCGDCINLNLTCPVEYAPLSPRRIIKYECSFQRYPDAGRLTIGCQQICVRNITKPECCSGYFGPLCQECPGGAENPCLGNGKCYNGLGGSGACSCDKGFTGPDCGRCVDTELAPPFCNVTYKSCGYRNGNCSTHAICSETGSGVSCRCPLGYVGDGYTCQSQCELLVNGGCHPQADCFFNISTSDIQCICKKGFHGNGEWCQANINYCALDNGGCDPERATCTYEVPSVTDTVQGPVNCTCKNGYIGDGKLCSTDIMDAISRIPDLRYFYTWIQSDEKANDSNVTQMLGDREARITVFLPVSKNWQTLDLASLTVVDDVLRLADDKDNSDGNKIRASKEDTQFTDGQISQQWGLVSLISLKGELINVTISEQHQFLANDVRIIQANIETFNGIIHLTESPIVTSESTQVGASTEGSGSNSPVVIACVVVAVIIVVLALVIGAFIYIKKHHEGFLSIFKRSQSSSESNISFARLSAQEEEDDTFKSPDNTQYDNPIFNDPDLL